MGYGDSGSITVIMGARRQKSAQEAWEASEDDALDEESELTGWRYYWSKPWELKSQLLTKFRGLREGSNKPEEDIRGWDIDTIFFLPASDAQCPTVLMGNPRTLPEYEAICLRSDAGSKDEYSRNRLYKVIGAAMVGAVL